MTFTPFEIILTSLAGLFYIYRIFLFYTGAKKERQTSFPVSDDTNDKYISIIVPARNEQDNIERAINSLLNLNYDKNKYEIIIVNDRSEDKTLELINKYKSEIQIVNITNDNANNHLQGKVGAMQAGIDKAKGELLFFTDADCRVDENWLTTISKIFHESDADFIASFTLIDGDKIFDKMQALEWIMIHTMASGEVGNNTPYGCFGNNIAMKKSAYEHIGGYENIEFSITEDLALMQAMSKAGMKIKYICNPNATVFTKPETTFSAFLNQHKRWALGGKVIKFKARFYIMTSLLIWSSLFVNLLFANYDLVFLILAIKILGDLLVLLPSLKQLKLTNYYSFSIFAVISFMLFEIILPFLLLNKKVVWKGQEFKA